MKIIYFRMLVSLLTSSIRTIPQGTYPQNRLIDGAAGAASPSSTPSVPIGGEADLDFEVAWPLIWPQKTINFQVDDEWYEGEENNGGHGPAPPPGSFNSTSPTVSRVFSPGSYLPEHPSISTFDSNTR